MAKIDLQSAFRMVTVHREDWDLLGIYWQNHYYVDTCLPFGLRSAPYLFNQFARAQILQTNYDMPHLIHYLDDYLVMEQPDSTHCAHQVDTFLHVCESLGIPVALEKLTSLTFLGLELDSTRQEIRLPQAKLLEILAELENWSGPHKTTKRKLLSLIGSLSFAARCRSSRPSVHTTPYQPKHQGSAPPPPHSLEFRGPCRHCLVEDLSPGLEWPCLLH